MSNSAFQKFKDTKLQMNEERNKERASITLDWYQKIEEMLGLPVYSRNYSFLQNVLEYIEKHEYISDKQIGICQRIYDHPDWGD